MKKWLVIIILFAACTWALNVLLMRKYNQENDQLLANSIKSERLNITLMREIFEKKLQDIHYLMHRGKNFDTLQMLSDSLIVHYPTLDSVAFKNFKRIYKKITSFDTIDIIKMMRSSATQQNFELNMLMWLHGIEKEYFSVKITVCGNPLMVWSHCNETPVGVPIKFNMVLRGWGTLDLSKNLVTKSPVKIDSVEKYCGYLPADKVGRHFFEGYYNVAYMGDTLPFAFGFEYYVTEPRVQSKLVDKEFLTIHQDNRIAFDFGQYKKKDVEIAVEGGEFKTTAGNYYIIHPTAKKVKIKFTYNSEGYPLELGYKEYEAR
ncbi:MAG: hypothetical protein V4613_07120 [Bacteroidota bacterium]